MSVAKSIPAVRRVALIGAGAISRYHLIAWGKLQDAARVVAVCDPDLTRAHACAREHNIPAVYGDADTLFANESLDLLDIASPRATHTFWVNAGADRGLDILCQKPLAPTFAEAEELVRRTAGKGRLMVHENWRFRPWYRQVKHWLDAGDLDDIITGSMVMFSSGLVADADGRRPTLERQPSMRHEPRLLIGETLIHHLDVLRWLAGPLRVVGARAQRAIPEVEGETVAAILLETAGGAPLVITATTAARGFPSRTQDRLTLVGHKGTAILEGSRLQLLGSDPRQESYDFDEGYQASFDGAISHFVECLRSGNRFETGPVDNLQTLQLVESAYRMAEYHL